MELITLVIGLVIRICVPAALLFWGASQLKAWDQRHCAD